MPSKPSLSFLISINLIYLISQKEIEWSKDEMGDMKNEEDKIHRNNSV